MDGDMLPLSQFRALELYDKDLTIYTIHDGGEASMVFDASDIEEHGGLFAVPYEEWEIARQELAPKEKAPTERDFLDAPHDAYAIYQVKHGKDYRDFRFISYDSLQNIGLDVQRDNYNFIYGGPLDNGGNTEQALDNLYQQFNLNHPADFTGHSLSVSDIIALKQNGVVSCHYVDSTDFREIPAFLQQENYLKNAEVMLEDDYGMIDGIINNGKAPSVEELDAQAKSGQPISLMDLARATHAEEKRPSVLEKLRQQPPQQERKNKAPKKSAEMEL